MVNGNGSHPELADLLAVAEHAGLNKKTAKAAAEQIYEIVRTELREYLHL